jgi:hypothetical protein
MQQYVCYGKLFISIFCSPDGWLEVSTHPEGSATDHLATGLLGVRLSLKNAETLSYLHAVAAYNYTPFDINQ